MRTFVCFFILILFFRAAVGQDNSDLVDEGLKGKVKSVLLEVSEADRENPKPVKKVQLEQLYSLYNQKGLKEKTVYFSAAGSLSYQSKYIRDAYSNVILETILDPNSQTLGKTFYNYDSKNRRSEEVILNSYNEAENLIFYAYDKEGNCIKKTYSDASKNVYEIHSFSFDAKKRPVKIQISDDKGNKKTDITLEYDESDKLTIKNTFNYTRNETSLKTEVFEYEFDSKGNWIKKVEYLIKNTNLIPSRIYERKIEYFE